MTQRRPAPTHRQRRALRKVPVTMHKTPAMMRRTHAMQRIIADPLFPKVCAYLFPDVPAEEMAARFRSFRSVRDFQNGFMYSAVWSVAHQTTDGGTVEGMEKLSPEARYLFVSNHRDIVLDAAILQVLLVDAGLPTSEITFGANLMQGQLVIDIGKSNKMFRVERPSTVTSPREFLQRSAYLSSYIRHTLLEKKESVWIAQRNGRTKDGRDATDQGIVKMFCMSGSADRAASLAALNIVPVALSYEWEPCDLLKARELLAARTGMPYVKKPGEDLNSILTGILQPKGRVHYRICDPITAEDLRPFSSFPASAFHRAVAALVDSRILPARELYPNNAIAWDLLRGESGGSYTETQREAFLRHLSEVDGEADADALKEILLGMYAAPFEN